MLFEQIENKLVSFNETPKSIVERFEKVDQGRYEVEDQEKLQQVFYFMYRYLSNVLSMELELKAIASNESELAEWFVFQCYYKGYA